MKPAHYFRGWLAVVLSLWSLLARAQMPAWERQFMISNTTSGVRATVADTSGNVYVAGFFEGSMAFGRTVLHSAGGADAFVAKWSSRANRFVWAQQAGGTRNDDATALALGSDGQLYVAGRIGGGGAVFGPLRLAATGPVWPDAFVAKLTETADGAAFTWVCGAGGPGADAATALAVEGRNLYLGGVYDSTGFQLGPHRLAARGKADIFVAKLIDQGSRAAPGWLQALGGTGQDVRTGLAVRNQRLYGVGWFDGPAFEAGSLTLANSSCPPAGQWAYADGFVVQLLDRDSSAQAGWLQPVGGQYDEQPTAVAATDSTVFVVGHFSAAGVTFPGPMVRHSSGLQDLFVAKFDPAGRFMWGVAKLLDGGTVGAFMWAQPGRGSDYAATALAVSGSDVFTGGLWSARGYFGMPHDRALPQTTLGWLAWFTSAPR